MDSGASGCSVLIRVQGMRIHSVRREEGCSDDSSPDFTSRVCSVTTITPILTRSLGGLARLVGRPMVVLCPASHPTIPPHRPRKPAGRRGVGGVSDSAQPPRFARGEARIAGHLGVFHSSTHAHASGAMSDRTKAFPRTTGRHHAPPLA